MTLTTNGKLIFNEIPEGQYPIPGKTTVYDTSEKIDLDNAPLNGGVLVKILHLSIDPYMRTRMRAPGRKESYVPHFDLRQPINNFGIVEVLRTEDQSVAPGDCLHGFFPFQQYMILPSIKQYKALVPIKKLDKSKGVPLTAYLGPGGLTGQTAFCAWAEFIAPTVKKGDVIFVSAGAGAVGSVVVQLAKQQGLKVIASAGAPSKIQFLKDLGADVAFNYKTESTDEILEREGPINFYWDNVGGSTLDFALKHAKRRSIFVISGAISEYNGQSEPLRNFAMVYEKAIILNGFISTDSNMMQHVPSFHETMPAMLAKGEIKYKEDITQGLENTGQAILDVQQGKNQGKSIVSL